MDAIKKKMQAMKMEKDTAMDKADTCEGQAKDANSRADKVGSIYISFLYYVNRAGKISFLENKGCEGIFYSKNSVLNFERNKTDLIEKIMIDE